MSLASFGGVLVDSQSLSSGHSSLYSQAALLTGSTAEITLDEDDVFQCGRCKKVFTSFHQFMLHKQEHQVASSAQDCLSDSLKLTLGRNSRENVNDTVSVEEEICLTDISVAKSSFCHQFTIPQNLSVDGDVCVSGEMGTCALSCSAFEDLSPNIDHNERNVNYSVEQSMLSNAEELSCGPFMPDTTTGIQTGIHSHKLLCQGNSASNNNAWMNAQKDVTCNVNYLTSEFSERHNLFIDSCNKKALSNVDYSCHNLLNGISFPGEEQILTNKSPQLTSDRLCVSENVSSTALSTEEIILQNSKDYLHSCKLLDELEKANEHRILNLSEVTVMEVEVPSTELELESRAIGGSSDLQVSSLVPLLNQGGNTLGQNSYDRENAALPEDCSLLGQGCNVLSQDIIGADHNSGVVCNASTSDSLDSNCSLLVNECDTLTACSTLDKSSSGMNFSVQSSVSQLACSSGNMEYTTSGCPTMTQACKPEKDFCQVSENESDIYKGESLGLSCAKPGPPNNSHEQGTSTSNQDCDLFETDGSATCMGNLVVSDHFSIGVANVESTDLNEQKNQFFQGNLSISGSSEVDGDLMSHCNSDQAANITYQNLCNKQKSEIEFEKPTKHLDIVGDAVRVEKRQSSVEKTCSAGRAPNVPEKSSNADQRNVKESRKSLVEGSLSTRSSTGYESYFVGCNDEMFEQVRGSADGDKVTAVEDVVKDCHNKDNFIIMPTRVDHKACIASNVPTEYQYVSIKNGQLPPELSNDFFKSENILIKLSQLDEGGVIFFQQDSNMEKAEVISMEPGDISMNHETSSSEAKKNAQNKENVPHLEIASGLEDDNIFSEDACFLSDNLLREGIDIKKRSGSKAHVKGIPKDGKVEIEKNQIKCNLKRSIKDLKNNSSSYGKSSKRKFSVLQKSSTCSSVNENQFQQNCNVFGSNTSGNGVRDDEHEIMSSKQLDCGKPNARFPEQTEQPNEVEEDGSYACFPDGQRKSDVKNRIDSHTYLDSNVVGYGDYNRITEATEEGLFEADPPGDLLNTVSIVYSAFEEESTTFSKIWNTDIEVENGEHNIENLLTGEDSCPSSFGATSLLKELRVDDSNVTRDCNGYEAHAEHPLTLKTSDSCTPESQHSNSENFPSVFVSEDATTLKPLNRRVEHLYSEDLVDANKSVSKVCSKRAETSIPKNLSGTKNHSVKSMPVKVKKTRESLWEPRALKLTCEYCHKLFAKLFDLRQHLRSHTGEKPFQCIACGRSFAQKSNLTKHIRTHKVWPKSVFTIPKNAIQKIQSNKITSAEVVVASDLNSNNEESNVSEKNLKEGESLCARIMPYEKGKRTLAGDDKEMLTTEERIIDNSYLCQFCDASFVSYFELKTHRKIHQDEKVYFCNRKGCKKTFPDLESFVVHVRKHAPQKTLHQCSVCNQAFCSLPELERHQNTHSPPDRTLSKRYLAKCPKCKNSFLSPEALDNHLRTVSHDLPCPECKRVFSCERNLRRHLNSHSTVYPFVCKECGKRFKTALYLSTHLAMHVDDKPFACSKCPAKFALKARLSRHFLIHAEDGRLKCPFHTHFQCSREFTRRDKLKTHVMSHTEHESIDCSFCKKQLLKFSAKKGLYQASDDDLHSSFSKHEEERETICATKETSKSSKSNELAEVFPGVDSSCGLILKSNDKAKNHEDLTLSLMDDRISDASTNSFLERKNSINSVKNTSCENIETNNVNFKNMISEDSTLKNVPTVGIIVLPMSQSTCKDQTNASCDHSFEIASDEPVDYQVLFSDSSSVYPVDLMTGSEAFLSQEDCDKRRGISLLSTDQEVAVFSAPVDIQYL